MIEETAQVQALQRSEFKNTQPRTNKSPAKLHELHSKDCTKCGKKMVNGECVDCNKVPTL
jgi:hypothetical protein